MPEVLHQTLMSGAVSQNAFADTGKKLNTMLDQGQSVDKRILKKAYEIFMEDTVKQLEFFWAILTIQKSEKGK